jgi:hypothetical protein
MLVENWVGSKVGNGIQIKKQRGGQRLKSLRHPRSQLHGPIPEIGVRNPKPHRPGNHVGTSADGAFGGVEEAAEEGEAATKPRRIILGILPSTSLRKWKVEEGEEK